MSDFLIGSKKDRGTRTISVPSILCFQLSLMKEIVVLLLSHHRAVRGNYMAIEFKYS